MIDILTAINGKPSIAVKFALDGLARLKDKTDYRIDMSTFGNVYEGTICCGCAATAAIQEIAGIDLGIEDVGALSPRAKALGFNEQDLQVFEYAIDEVRKGYLIELGDFCKVNLEKESEELENFYNAYEGLGVPLPDFQVDTDFGILTLETAYKILIKAGK